ncbi:endonuclease I family protein [Lunatibacter salilacus]|uniref:endonuclease I family protein n=1 Tax=Lunatibacter salilacus TaxID=2483804 RepID=UPI00131D8E0D|nr:endonuclease [Lunatibacter salilacus]
MRRENSLHGQQMKRIVLFIAFFSLPIGLFQTCTVRRIFPHDSESTQEAESVDLDLEVYYNLPDTLVGEALKLALHRIIRNHTVYTYDQLWDILPDTDQDPSNPDQLILLYSLRSQSVAHRDRGTRYDYESNGYTLIDSWNREHVWPKSHGFPNLKDTAYTDLHHLRPGDRSVNSARNTRSFDEADFVYFDNGGTVETENRSSKEFWVWEPSDEVKGDIARMLFYMAVRYEGPGYDLELVDSIVPRQNKLPLLGKLSTLLEWHRRDPVNSWEKRRNEVIFNNYQGNRNPFIDNPEWVELIWVETNE